MLYCSTTLWGTPCAAHSSNKLVVSYSYCVLCVECTVEADEVQGKCSVVFGEEAEDLDKMFLEKQDVFWFLEVRNCFV